MLDVLSHSNQPAHRGPELRTAEIAIQPIRKPGATRGLDATSSASRATHHYPSVTQSSARMNVRQQGATIPIGSRMRSARLAGTHSPTASAGGSIAASAHPLGLIVLFGMSGRKAVAATRDAGLPSEMAGLLATTQLRRLLNATITGAIYAARRST